MNKEWGETFFDEVANFLNDISWESTHTCLSVSMWRKWGKYAGLSGACIFLQVREDRIENHF